jgi:uncharacterized membrane protein
MTLLDQTRTRGGRDTRSYEGRQQGQQEWQGQGQQQQEQINVSEGERATSLAAGSILAMLGLARRSIPGMLVAGVGGALLYRGATGHCPVYESLGLDTAHGDGRRAPTEEADEELTARGVHVQQAMLINRSPAELYKFWRNFENLPRIMTHLESVRVVDERHSHWVARAPRIVGGEVEWDAEVTRDDPNELIAWRSLPGSSINTTGQIRFSPALGDRGTEVHVYMDYVPPAGRLGHWVASALGHNPKRVVREDLRNFKRIMEIGEILTIIGQPHGTCTGQGERYTESEWQPLFM